MADVTDATFQVDVLERSAAVPVVVDLWAPWCGPCRTLGPIIEKVVAETDGRVELAKVDTDANPSVAQAFRVQSIPAVYALKDGKVVDGFIGARPEHEVRTFVESLMPSEEESEVERLVALGDETSLRAALELDADDEGAVAALASLLVESDRAEEALSLLARIPESAVTRPIAARARVGATDDPGGRLESLLTKVKEDPDARQEFIDLLELMGPDDPSTADWRRRLTTALY